MEIKSILLFKIRYIGDVLLTTPVIRLLRKSYPQAEITMVVNKGTEAMILHNPHLNQIITLDRQEIKNAPFFTKLRREYEFLKNLRRKRYDLSIDFANGDRAAFLSLLTGVPSRVGFYSPEGFSRHIFNKVIHINGPKPIHMVERNLLLAEQGLGLTTTDKALELHTGKEDDQFIENWLKERQLLHKRLVVINHGGRHWFKCWPKEKWVNLIDRLQTETDYQIIIVGGAEDFEITEYILSRIKSPVHALIGKGTLLKLAALLKKTEIFITNDSGPMHIATAMGAKVIALFGPSEMIWTPWGKRHRVISKNLPCSPCSQRGCDREQENCMELISVDEVFSAI